VGIESPLGSIVEYVLPIRTQDRPRGTPGISSKAVTVAVSTPLLA
jgi:hypothetical protein